MRKITLLMVLFAMFNLNAQTVFTEDFNAALSLPAGWTNNDIEGGGEVWAFATGGEAIGYADGNTIYYEYGGMSGNYGVFDSFAYAGIIAENAALESPAFDCSGLTNVTLNYNHFFTSGYGGAGFVEVYNGSAWVEVASYGASTVYGLQNIDVSAELAGVSNAKVRFRWVGNYAWGWAFDNVEVYQCTEIAVPACTIPIAPVDTATDVVTTESTDGLSRVVAFSWDAIPGALNYDFVFEGNTIANVSTPNINITGLDYDTTYSWSVIPINCFGASTGCATWTFTSESAPPPPANDNVCNAEGLTVDAAPLAGTNALSTFDATEVAGSCWGSTTTGNTVWYSFVAPASGLVEITTDFETEMTDSQLALYAFTDCTDYSTGTELECSDDDGETGFGYMSVINTAASPLTGGSTYYIQVDGYGNAVGAFQIQVKELLINDECSGAIEVIVGGAAVAYDNTAATDSGVVDTACFTGATVNDIWYTFTTPATGISTLVITGPATMYALYSDCATAIDGGCSSDNPELVPSATYLVAITDDGVARATGAGTISVTNTLSTQDFDNDLAFTYYPNPVSNVLVLKAQKDIDNITVYNMLGQEVLRTAPNAVNTEVNMSALQAGAYFVKVTIGNATETVRIIKN
ncbi:T9SS type A sorting domain-containing protein [Lacinutrix sp. WUR7]|uniref:T9SS type A sorting domain-containing protein n=1 Tax=Lacinutrix sp. WUR7 TaxID=2653681 RepID=UPI00193DB157|nr:T9SS type A sorting domain-containing protein [Lacinutrix sp. WUR7]QRM90902.1 T9SS type A sorting domain-containing protein [Lacinutrix sp. WUR7]